MEILKLSILKISAFALLVSFCAPMGLRAEATIENASQLTFFSASSAHSMSSDTHSEIEAVSVLSDAELKETQGAFWPYVIGASWGAVGGAGGYISSYYGSYNTGGNPSWNWGQFGASVATGAISGAVAVSYPIAGIAAGVVFYNKFSR